MTVEQQQAIQITISDTDFNPFLLAISKLYQRVNAIGFDHLGLTKDERYSFNEFVEQVALLNQNE